jgi:hypothetical protein
MPMDTYTITVLQYKPQQMHLPYILNAYKRNSGELILGIQR